MRKLSIPLGVALLLAGCGSGQANRPTKVQAKHVTAPGAQVTFLSPRPNTTTGPNVTARVVLKNFKLVSPSAGTTVHQGQGQLHFMMDGGRYDRPRYTGAAGVLSAKLNLTGKYTLAFAPQLTYRELPPGSHTLAVSLANVDRSPTGVSAVTSFTVR